MKKVLLVVINDVVTDQRLERIAGSLHDAGYVVEIIGRKLRHSPEIQRYYRVRRLRFLFNSSFAFYACFNLRLFFILLFSKFDILVANDLDTLPASHLAAFLRRKKLVFDSHELFPEVPELQHRPFVKSFWQWVEKVFVRRQKYAYTVCQSIADHYKAKYNVHFGVIRNVPYLKPLDNTVNIEQQQSLIVYQGALNLGRGLETLIQSLLYDTSLRLLIIGTGDIEGKLRKLVEENNLSDRVTFAGRIMPVELKKLTLQGRLGVSLEENIGLNYYFALPNKLFDYIHAGLPVLVSDFPEMKRVVEGYNIGQTLKSREPEQLAKTLRSMMDSELYNVWTQNLAKASVELNWQREERMLIDFYKKLL